MCSHRCCSRRVSFYCRLMSFANTQIATVLKLSGSICSSSIPINPNALSLLPMRSPCPNISSTTKTSTQATRKKEFPKLTISSPIQVLNTSGPSFILARYPRRGIRFRKRLISASPSRSGSIWERLQQKLVHNTRKIQRSQSTIQRASS